jgi:hypothetical protein
MQQLLDFFHRIEEDVRITTAHISVYASLLKLQQEQEGNAPLRLFSREVMKVCKISSYSTYHKTIRQLHEFGYIQYTPSFNHFTGSLIELIMLKKMWVMNLESVTLVVIPQAEWESFKLIQSELLQLIKGANTKTNLTPGSNYMSAIEFMNAVRIKRSRFAKLVNASKIKVIKKGRRIYVPIGEVERYFSDKGIL